MIEDDPGFAVEMAQEMLRPTDDQIAHERAEHTRLVMLYSVREQDVKRLEAALAFYKRGVEAYRSRDYRNRNSLDTRCLYTQANGEPNRCVVPDCACAWEAEAKKREVE